MGKPIFLESMLIYWGAFCFLALFSVTDILPISDNSKRIILNFCIICAIVFVGGRYWCDNDYANYVTFFEGTPPIHKTNISDLFQIYLLWQVELGYILSCSALKLFSLNYQFIFILCAVMTFALIAKFFSRISLYPIFSLFLFFATFFTLPFVQMRFGVATACVCYALLQLDEQNTKGYWKWMIIGILFHMTALIGIVVYYIYKIPLTRNLCFILLFSSFIFSFVPIKLIFINVLSYLGLTRYLGYTDEAVNGFVSLIYLIILLLPFIYYEPILRKRIPHYHLLLVMGMSSILVGCITREVPILNRLYLLLSVSYCSIIPSYFSLLKKNGTILFSWLLLILYALIKYIPSLNHLQPYQNFLFI